MRIMGRSSCLGLTGLLALLASANAFFQPALVQQGATRASARSRGDVAMKAVKPHGVKHGSMVALVTPFTPTGEIDEKALRSLLQWHIDSKTDGLVVLGTTGEASTMSMDERARVLDITREVAKGKCPIVVGTGTINPHSVVKMTQQAKDYGADASLVVTPYYVKPTQQGLVNHFKFVAESVDLPMLLYNVPGRTGADIKPETVGRIAETPGIIGIKEATGDVSRVASIQQAAGKDFLLLSGDDETGAEFVLKGGHGVISVTTNVVPATMAKLMAACLKKDEATAHSLNKPLELLHQRLFLQSNPIPAKWALYRMGKIGSYIRPPLTVLESEFHAPLEEAMRAAGAL